MLQRVAGLGYTDRARSHGRRFDLLAGLRGALDDGVDAIGHDYRVSAVGVVATNGSDEATWDVGPHRRNSKIIGAFRSRILGFS